MKSIRIFASLIVVLLFAGLLNAQTVQSGTFKADKSTTGYSLDNGSGSRSVLLTIKFDKPFANKPQVMAAVTMIDGAKEANVRFDVKTEIVTPEEVQLNIKTWGDTKIFQIGGTWIAIDPTPVASAPVAEKKAKKAKK